MEKQWKPEYLQPFLNCMSNDDSFIRWFALMSIFKNERANFDTILPTLLNNNDLRKRGLAAYVLIEFWQEKGFAELKKMLSEKIELIRFDAVSALVLSGGQKGIEILRLHQKSETSPYLASLLAKALKEKKP